MHRWEETNIRTVLCPANCGETLELSVASGINLVAHIPGSLWSAKQNIECPNCQVRFTIDRCVVYPVRQIDLLKLFKPKAAAAGQ